jgi:hypothetical protein
MPRRLDETRPCYLFGMPAFRTRTAGVSSHTARSWPRLLKAARTASVLSFAVVAVSAELAGCSTDAGTSPPANAAVGGASGHAEAGGQSENAGAAGDGTESGDAGGAGVAGAGLWVRIANDMKPDFLDLDACFGTPDPGGELEWSGPLWRGDLAHGATFNRLTAYRALAPGATKVRFVAHGNSDCNASIEGISEQSLEPPLALAGDASTWFTIVALGGIAGQGTQPFSIQTLVDRQTTPTTPFALRVVVLDPDLAAVELGSLQNPDYTGYDQRVAHVSYGAPSPYTSWQPSLPTPLYFGFKIFLDGQSAGTPLIVGDRAQSDATARGAWTVFVVPKREGSDKEEWSFCADGVDGPRLCYPCGLPGCEGR